MQYIVDVVINKPVEEVVALFDDPDNLHEWMEGLQSFEHLEGDPGAIGSKSRLRFKMGDRDIEMIETITARNLPDEFSATYETDGVFNTNRIGFVETGAGQTRMTMNPEFQFTNFPMKIMAFFAPFIFKKQTRKNLEAFKAFAEKQ